MSRLYGAPHRALQDLLSDADQRRAKDEGVISEEEWVDQIRRGDPRA